jgi:hypothetical protein
MAKTHARTRSSLPGSDVKNKLHQCMHAAKESVWRTYRRDLLKSVLQ